MKSIRSEFLQKKIHTVPLVIVILCVIVSIAIILNFSVSNKDRIVENNREYLLQTTYQVSSRLNSRFKNSIEKLKILSKIFSINLTSNDNVNENLVNLRNALEDSVFDYIEYADSEGVNHNALGGLSDAKGVNHNALGGLSDAKDREYYIEAMKGKSGITYVSRSRATCETLMSFYSPIYQGKDILGSLIGVQQALRLSDAIDINFYGQKINVYLFDNNGTIISSTTQIDTTKGVNIKDVLGIDFDNIKSSKSAQLISLDGNLVGAGIAKLKHKDWYILLEYPNAVVENMIEKSNNLVFILAITQLIVFIILIAISIKIIDKEKKYIVKKNIEIESILNDVKKYNEELSKKELILEEVKDVLVSSGMGTWHIELFDNQEPRMMVDEKMKNLLGISEKNLSPEEIYNNWFNNIKPEEVQSVLDSVGRMKSGQRDENTYLWKHPIYGMRYVRCGGSAVYIKDKGYVFRGYHYDVTDMIVKEQKLIKQSYTDKLTNLQNRTAYENDLEILEQSPFKENFFFFIYLWT